MEGKKIIAIIPARGGSKGIPRKNIRLLNGKPLLWYIINSAKKSSVFDKIVVTTDDEEISEISKLYGVDAVERPPELAKDDVTLDPVVYHAASITELKDDIKYDIIVTLQPTAPLTRSETIKKAVEIFTKNIYDTLISVERYKHLYWIKKDNEFKPLYAKRKNRQYLEPIYKETGAILICKREILSKDSRIGKKLFLFEISKEEAIDIDDGIDWIVTKSILKKLKIAFVVNGDYDIGLGHVYRALTLASRLTLNEIFFVMDGKKELGITKVKDYFYPIKTYNSEKELIEILRELKPEIVINDILDTTESYIKSLKKTDFFVVNFEDLGEGSKYADIVFNALYEWSDAPKNHYYGYKYECLREQFYLFPPKTTINNVENLLITFGGTDQNNLTFRTLKILYELGLKDIIIKLILGLGYKHDEQLYKLISKMIQEGFRVDFMKDVKIMAKHMYDSNLIICSNGRTVYEAASLGIPMITISQNEREVRHLFSNICKGIINLGLAQLLTDDEIKKTIRKILEDSEMVKNMHKEILKYSHIIRKGYNKVISLILERYYKLNNISASP